MNLDTIKTWIVHEGGICKTSDNHFGGDPTATPRLNLQIQQRPGELAACIDFLLQKKESGETLDYYAEIGACAGGTTLTMQTFLKFKELLIIDDGGAEDPEFYAKNRNDHGRGSNLTYIPRIEIIGSSSELRVIEQAKNAAKIHQYDVLFIDGDHSYAGVKNDTINYLSIVRDGGYIIFHDTCHIPGIQQWIQEIPQKIEDLTFIKTFGQSDAYTDQYPNGIGLTVFQKGSNKMKWTKDLICDIRTHSYYDDVDEPPIGEISDREISECNIEAVKQQFFPIKDKCRAILEIGIFNNSERSLGKIFIDNKLDNTIYVGIDIADKSYLNNPAKNIHTIHASSSEYEKNMQIIRSLGVTEFDFIFIDGWHSINQCLLDWEYTRMLSDRGIVGLHDTRFHPGPNRFITALNTNIWDVKHNMCLFGSDYGIGFAKKKLP